MCGIAGEYNRQGKVPDLGALTGMSRTIAHRGPDGEAFFIEPGIGLAHRHLRIIDLSDAALQPMSSRDNSLHLTFNGEIYNYVELRPILEAAGHVFTSHSDTEVLLAAYTEWGRECLHRLNGMFAFAVWDSQKQELFVARDRLGVKPLYYHWNGDTLLFASEIKALLAHPDVTARPCYPAIVEYMSATFTLGTHTWFEGVERLLPGHAMVANVHGLAVDQWWDLPAEEDEPGLKNEKEYVAGVRTLLEDSVRLRLRSDVPLGAHLSGGLDSSSVVALLSKRLLPIGERVRTFSGAFANGPLYDERRYITEVVKRYNTNHHETLPTAADLPALLERIMWHMDEPAAGPGILLQWAVCESTAQSGVVVINGGQGGDEAWAGYFGYVPAYFKTLLKAALKKPTLMPDLLRSVLIMLGRPALRSALLNSLRNGRRSRAHASSKTGPWASARFAAMATSHEAATNAETRIQGPKLGRGRKPRNPLAAALYYDLKWYLPALLQVEDRMSMAFSLESRAPLLDYRLIELSARVPGILKMKGLDTKHVLKLAVKDLLPTDVYRRTDKMGMPTPVALWFRGALREWIKEQLTSAEVQEFGILDQSYVEEALKEHRSGARDCSLDLWKMLNLVTWWRIFIAGQVPTAHVAAEYAARSI